MKARSIGKLYTQGSSTVEILIAFLVLTMSVSTVIMIFFGNQSVAIDSETNNEALYKTEQLLEKARSDSTFDFHTVNPLATIVDGIYKKSLEVTMDPTDFFTKKVTSKVIWKVDGNRDQVISLSTIITNPSAVDGGNTCNSILSGDWRNPQSLGSVDVGSNNGGTDIDILNARAFVTADASASAKHDFYIVDVSNPNINNLPILGSINTGPGLKAVHAGSKYAYVANESRTGQLQIINIQTNTPSLVRSYAIPGVTGSGAQALGNSIFYKNNYVYIGLTTTATGPEFNIVDVTNPSSPVLRGSYAIGHDVNAIDVRGDYAYIASPDNAELKILNISNPASPSLVGSIDLSDNSANGKSIFLVGNTLYLGRTVGTSPQTKELQLLNIASPSSPATISAMDIGSTINAIAVRDNLIFMVTSAPNLGFQIWDMSTGALYGSKNIQQTSTGGLDCEGNYIYVAQRSNKALQIIGPGI